MPDSRMPEPTPVRSIREPGAAPRSLRHDPAPRMTRPTRMAPGPAPLAPRSRPDPNPLRLMIGLAGLASAAAFTTAMLPSVTPRVDAAQVADPAAATAAIEQPSVYGKYEGEAEEKRERRRQRRRTRPHGRPR